MKKKYYKLTTRELTTHNGFKCEIGKTYKTDGAGELCGPGWLHCYTSPSDFMVKLGTFSNGESVYRKG